MKRCYRKLVFLTWLLLSYSLAGAQIRIEQAPHEHGMLKKELQTLQFIRSFKAMSDAKALSLDNSVNKMMDIICRLPQLHSLTGYNAKVNVAGNKLEIRDAAPRFTVYCYLRYLIRDSRYQGIKESMDGADLYLNINAFGIFYQMGNYWQECSKLHFPLFFEEPALTDSTPDYIEFRYKGDPLRIVTAGARPLYVPLTRKEFMRFLIANDELAVKDGQEALRLSREGEEQIKKRMATQSENDRAYAASSLKSMDYSIDLEQKNITELQKEIVDCRSLLNEMPPQDANAPARLDYNKKSSAARMGSLDRLVPPGRREGVMLVKLNPGFYDHSPNAPVAQMIAVYYAWPTVGFANDPDYLQQAMLDVFNHLDYHQLKESLK